MSEEIKDKNLNTNQSKTIKKANKELDILDEWPIILIPGYLCAQFSRSRDGAITYYFVILLISVVIWIVLPLTFRHSKYNPLTKRSLLKIITYFYSAVLWFIVGYIIFRLSINTTLWYVLLGFFALAVTCVAIIVFTRKDKVIIESVKKRTAFYNKYLKKRDLMYVGILFIIFISAEAYIPFLRSNTSIQAVLAILFIPIVLIFKALKNIRFLMHHSGEAVKG